MTLTKDDYLTLLQALLPEGKALNREPDSNLTAFLDALAEEFARVDERCDALLTEIDPSVTSELLTDWERLCGLPSDCTGQLGTLQQRRQAILGVLTGTGGQSKAYFIALAASLGYEIEIEETAAHTFEVHAPEDTFVHFTVGKSTVGEPLQDSGNDLLECVINARKPAHSHVTYVYDL